MSKAEAAYVFVDGQNIATKSLAPLAQHVAQTCSSYAVRVYNNARQPAIDQLQWCSENAFADYISVLCKAGKNSVDIRIAVDAAVLGCTQSAEVFILATNDSDFTHVASELIARGKTVQLLHTSPEPPKGYSKLVATLRIGTGSGAVKSRVTPSPNTPAAPAADATALPDAVGTPTGEAVKVYTGQFADVARRIIGASPFFVPSGYIYGVYSAVSGTSWKSSKNLTAERWIETVFPLGDICFVNDSGGLPNTGFFCTKRFADPVFSELRAHARETFPPALLSIGIRKEKLKPRAAAIIDQLRQHTALTMTEIMSALNTVYAIEKSQTRSIMLALCYGGAIESASDVDAIEAISLDDAKLRLTGDMTNEEFVRCFRRGLLWELSAEPDNMLPGCVVANIGTIFDLPAGVVGEVNEKYVEWVRSFTLGPASAAG